MSELRVDNLDYFVGDRQILKEISLEIRDGQFVGIIGANGSGKSTLLKNIYRLYRPKCGKINIDREDILKMKPKEVAKRLAVLSQESTSEFDFKVEDVVKMGRYPYKLLFEDYSKDDINMVYEMLDKVGLKGFKDRSFNSLSGGEKQRVLIARALVQKAKFLILDEPTNHLDIGYQFQIMELIKKLKITTFAAIHDMNIAAMFCDYLIVIKKGEIIAKGKKEEILTKDMIKEIFGVDCYIGKNPITEDMHVFYLGTHKHVNGIGSCHVHLNGYTGYHKHY